MNGRKPPVDPKVAAALSAVFAILGALGVFAMLGLSADQVAILVGALGTLGTMARAYFLSRAHRKAAHESALETQVAVDEMPNDLPRMPPTPNIDTDRGHPLPRGLVSVRFLFILSFCASLPIASAWALGWMGLPVALVAAVLVSFALVALTLWTPRWLRYFSIPALCFALTGCAGYGGPGLSSIVGRIDVTRAVECAKQPTPADKARCLGVSLLSDGLGIALDQAAHWGEKALKAASGTGADDLEAKDLREIERNTDTALDVLGAEIAAQQAADMEAR